MMSLQEASMGEGISNLLAKTPDSFLTAIKWLVRAMLIIFAIYVLERTLIDNDYKLISKNIILPLYFIMPSLVIFRAAATIIKSRLNAKGGEFKEINHQYKLGTLSIIGTFCVIIFMLLSYASYNEDIVNLIYDNYYLFLALFAIYVSVYIIFTIKLYKESDEFSKKDQLFSNFIAIWFYAILFPAWWLLWRFQILPEPNGWIIYGLTMLVGVVTMVYRQKI